MTYLFNANTVVTNEVEIKNDLGNAIPVIGTITNVTNIVDNLNSSNIALSGNATFPGTWVNTLNFSQIEVLTRTDQPSLLSIHFSEDASQIDHTHSYAITANVGEHFQVPTHANFYRTALTNSSSSPQTYLRLQTILKPVTGSASIVEADNEISGDDDCMLTKAIITGQSITTGQFISAKMSPDGGLLINQDISVDPTNSSQGNLTPGGTFIGNVSSNITATVIQVFLHTDQNCKVYVDQSQDGSFWDVIDTYDYYYSVNDFALNVTAVGAFYRLRVTNVGTATTTYFRLQAITVPISSPLPRSLSVDGFLQVAVKETVDSSNFPAQNSPFGSQLTAPVINLVGSIFNDGVLDAGTWNVSGGVGGTAAPTAGVFTLSTGTTANNATSITSISSGRYVIGEPTKFRCVVRVGDTGTINNVRQWGAATATDGAYFELSGTTFSFVTKNTGVATSVNNGTFNGRYGNTFALDTNFHTYEIVMSLKKVYFYIDLHLIHTVAITNSAWTSLYNLPVWMINNNSGGSTSNVSIQTLGMSILRMGVVQNQLSGKNIAGAATTVVKVGSGNLQSVVINSNTGTSITLYDSLSGTGTIIATINPNQIVTLDFKGIVFSTGLTVVTVGNTCNCTVIYE